ncbi:ABC transporter ATP-binding protein [Uliginosibacterium paludis]|uniref:ABC transporter ATP-binding protein n=1 Tax=Uliginosibacterium paludis TaxID=1615952 RepID=A0ABV2CPK2_9RHOO
MQTGSNTEMVQGTNGAALAVCMQGIHKHFGAVHANDGVNLSVRAGSIHALVGENGAGKSTLMSVLYGFYTADAGSIAIDGRAVEIRNAQQAIALGLGMVHQHFMLVDSLSALDNVLLGSERSMWLPRAQGSARSRLEALMASSGLRVNLDAVVADLSVGDRQRLEILKAIFRGARILILDEPTAVLTPQETAQLFEVLARLREQGSTILLITHKLKEVMHLCDQVTVMRAGRVVHECAIAETSIERLAEAMVGRKVASGRVASAREPGEARLQAEGLQVLDAMGVARLRGVSLCLRAGEIVGIAGVAGNGQSELLEVLSGLRKPAAGTLRVGTQTFGSDAGASWLTPHEARRLRLAHVPEDRHARAMVMGFPAWESAVLGYEALPAYSTRFGWMRLGAMRDATRAMMARFDVRPQNPELGSAKFSGGNQQKLVLAREIGQAPEILLVGQPTRGVDIGAIEFIHARLRELRDAGCAVLVVSSELDEILALADRVLVMNDGRITGEMPGDACDETRIGLLMCETTGQEQGVSA